MARPDLPDPGLPIKLRPVSNGEFAPAPVSPAVREAVRRARARCDELAGRLGMSRRRFLLSSMGAATTLLALGACSEESGESEGGGRFDLDESTTTDPGAAADAIGDDGTPIVDVQTHLLEFDLSTAAPDAFPGSGFPQAGCGDDDARACFSIERWLEEVFVRSDTSLAILSAVPFVAEPDPLSADVMARGLAAAEQLCGEGRALMQGHAVPNVGPLDAALDAMDDLAGRFPLSAWKTYTHVGEPYLFTDDVGQAFLDRVRTLGPPIVAVHKGFSGGSPFGSPVDIGPAAVANPDLDLVVYHSGYEGGTEGPYTEETADVGINRLVTSVREAGLGPGSNVHAELGSTWRSVMTSPDQAAHVLGKLLLHLGPDNVIWGTDSIWYGSPQDQIQAFRAFQISDRFQEEFGYPALTDEVKAKILGGNAARLHGLDPATLPCRPSPEEVEGLRQESAIGNVTYGPTTAAGAAAVFAADHPWSVRP